MTDPRILPAAQAQLIDRAGRATPVFYDFMRRTIGSGSTPIPPDIADASFVTVTNESDVLPNSKHLAAGANITLTENGNALVIAAQTGAGDGYPAQLGYSGIV